MRKPPTPSDRFVIEDGTGELLDNGYTYSSITHAKKAVTDHLSDSGDTEGFFTIYKLVQVSEGEVILETKWKDTP